MEEKRCIIFHLIMDGQSTDVGNLIRELGKIPDVQVWKVENSMIHVGKLPKIFKAIPVDELEYSEGWLTIKLYEKGACLAKHIFVVCEPKDKPAIDGIIKSAMPTLPGLRVRIEEEES